MKKLLLFALVAGLGGSSFAQNRMKEVAKFEPQKYDYVDMSTKTSAPNQHQVQDVQAPNPKGSKAIEQVTIGKSGPYGVYSVLLPGQKCLSYVPGINTISFTHRGEENEYPGADNSTILGTVSTDNGATFEQHLVLAESNGQRHRYPSGVLFNPAGNTTPNEAYIIAAGPSIQGSDSWDQNFFASAKLDDSNHDLQTIAYTGSQDGSELIRRSMSVTDNGNVYIAGYIGQQNGGNAIQSDLDLVCFKGTQNGTTWTWERNTERVDLTAASDGNLDFSYDAGLAFAQNGSIGYKWLIGKKTGATGGMQPVLYYTEDAGTTWTETPVVLENNSVISQYIRGTNQNTGPVWPQFSETEAVVDANGNLQMFAKVFGSFSTHPDSIGYYYAGFPAMIFNITIDKNAGVQNVMFVDSVMGKGFTKQSAPQYCFGGEAGWDNRLQASVSNDGSVIGVSWSDTPNAEESYEGYNAAPDLKGTARTLATDHFYRNAENEILNFTADDIFTGTYRFSFAAEKGQVLVTYGEPGVNHLLVPMSTSVSLSEFEAADEAATITHTLVNIDGLGGVPIPIASDAVAEMEAASAFTVSQNQPNPFTGTTTITVSSNTVAPVSVEVSNLMGQTVFTQNEGTINGNKEITINASNLEAGIYFYTVRVGGESQTKKMMVK